MKELTKQQIISVMEMLLLDGDSRNYEIVTIEKEMTAADLFVSDNPATGEVILQPGKYLTAYACDYDCEEHPHLMRYLMRGEVEFKVLETNLSIVVLLCLERH